MAKVDFFDERELFEIGAPPAYEGERLRQIAFPLGGIGTGCISLSGKGELVDWEIFNRPNKGSFMPYTFFTLWAQAEGRPAVTRVVQAPPEPPYSGEGGGGYRGFGFGVTRENGSGLPHMRAARFIGQFPLAEIAFDDPKLPVSVRLEAYSPFIPLNADDSGLPIAVLRYHVRDTGDKAVRVSLAGNLFNPIGYPGKGHVMGDHLGGNLNTPVNEGDVRGLLMISTQRAPDDPAYGSMALTTTWRDTFTQACWLRAGWFDMMHDFWDHFSETGALPERFYGPSEKGKSDVGTLGLRAKLQPGEEIVLPFFITWYFPTFEKYWGIHGEGQCCCGGECHSPRWKNYYASQWRDALDVARYYAANETRLYGETKRFHDALFESKLPPYVLDALSSQASILHSPTVLRLEDGTFYGFEGCHCDGGCCEGSCTHVWNYAQTVAFLFPALERSLRDADYTYNLRDDGHMCFRLQLPLGAPLWDFHPAADGQMGGVMKVYRDWRLCGDDAWLRDLWPKLKKALEFAWTQWDQDRDGVMEGIQHNTYDIEFHGANTMMGSFYLGALRAAEEMALHLGDAEAAARYRTVYESGRAKMDARLFNGEYFTQHYDPATAPKYQYGEGCLSDQLIGQWFAHIVGLGYLFDRDHVRSAIKAIFEHNWRTDFWEHPNPQRIYALNDEQGLLLCSWPKGGRPALPFVYSDEVWCGIEYQVASHLIYEGFVKEGLSIVKGLRARHDGLRRNPWNEFECGSHYARSLASWAVLTALAGYTFDLPNKTLGFAPRLRAEDWRSVWTTGTGWGVYAQQTAAGRIEACLSVEAGALPLQTLRLGGVKASQASVVVDGQPIAAEVRAEGEGCVVAFASVLTLSAGQTATVTLL